MKLTKLSSLLTGVVLFVVTTAAEKCDKAAESVSTPCEYSATAKDFTGLDGCGMLLILDSGEKLLVTNLGEFKPLYDGEMVRISYVKAEDMMSICMTEDAIVNVTCMARKSGSNWISDCPAIIDPFRVAWMEKVMQEINPRQVEEIWIDGMRAYRFYALSGTQMYSCQGEHLCTSTYNTQEGCADVLKKTSDDVKVIYVVNE